MGSVTPANTPLDSDFIESSISLCTSESCPYKKKYECLVIPKSEMNIDVNKICSNENCLYQKPLEECLPEPIKRQCAFKDCPFTKKYGHCGIDVVKAIKLQRKCSNKKCTKKKLCQQCNIKRNISVNSICDNELCPYKIPYEECRDLEERLINFDKNNLGICTNDLCPYKPMYKQCEVFINGPEICTNEECPYNLILEEEEEKESSVKLPICKNKYCTYKLYEQSESEKSATESLENESKHSECIDKSVEDICDNKDCFYELEDGGFVTDSKPVESCPYKTNFVQCELDPVTETCSNRSCPYQIQSDLPQATCSVETCQDKTKYVDCRLDLATNICSNEACPLGIEYGECFFSSTPSLESEVSIKNEYKWEVGAQHSEAYMVVEDILDKLLSSLSVNREDEPPGMEEVPCVAKTCTFKKRQWLETCLPFEDVCVFVEEFVDCIILDATDAVIKKLNDIEKPEEGYEMAKYLQKVKDFKVRTVQAMVTYHHSIFKWPSIKDFTIHLGAQRIIEYIACCEVHEQWLCGIFYKKTTVDPISHFHHYEVMFGLPTAIYPVPQVTASIYFTIEVSKVIPNCCPIHVTFQLETNKYEYDAAITTLNEKWVLNILHSKIAILRSINY